MVIDWLTMSAFHPVFAVQQRFPFHQKQTVSFFC
jgi:hypothetical protein